MNLKYLKICAEWDQIHKKLGRNNKVSMPSVRIYCTQTFGVALGRQQPSI